jgi:hypothetical protein
VVVLALILLVLVAVLVVAIVVSNPQPYELSIFGAIVPANTAGIFLTGAAAMAVTIVALLLLRTGIRRARARRKHLKELESLPPVAASDSTSPAEAPAKTTGPETSKDPSPDTSRDTSVLEPERQSSTTAAERQAMLDEADELTREEPQKPAS